jgi:hypothetical protein
MYIRVVESCVPYMCMYVCSEQHEYICENQ